MSVTLESLYYIPSIFSCVLLESENHSDNSVAKSIAPSVETLSSGNSVILATFNVFDNFINPVPHCQ
jgi:hypothetical protein